MCSELENRGIVVIDIDKGIFDRRGSMRQTSCSEFSSDPPPFVYSSVQL